MKSSRTPILFSESFRELHPDKAHVRMPADGMTAASDHADRDTPGWTRTATLFLLAYAGCHGRFIAEDVLAAAALDATFPAPPDDRAWGSVFHGAARRGEIVKVGYKARNQGNPCVEWARKASAERSGA